jgi:nucleotide-binding universal stress UspA family protein
MVGKEFLKNILVPIDRSTSSLMAEEMAALLAKMTGATVTVLHVIQRAVPLYVQTDTNYNFPNKVMDEVTGALEQEGEKLVNNAQVLFHADKVQVKAEILREQDPPDSILEYSNAGYDLIVIGVHGENETDPYTLGSVAKKVIMHAKIPILIIKSVSSLSSLLVCVDGSEHSIKALEYGIRLAKKMGSKITLLNVQEHRLYKVSPKTAQDLGERIFSKALDAIGKEKLKIDKKLEIGVPSDTIVKVADEGKYDLIVLGSRGLGTVKRFLLGSVSDDVSQKAKCSVLMVPASA